MQAIWTNILFLILDVHEQILSVILLSFFHIFFVLHIIYVSWDRRKKWSHKFLWWIYYLMNNTYRPVIIEIKMQGDAKNFLEISVKECWNTGKSERTQRKKSTKHLSLQIWSLFHDLLPLNILRFRKEKNFFSPPFFNITLDYGRILTTLLVTWCV